MILMDERTYEVHQLRFFWLLSCATKHTKYTILGTSTSQAQVTVLVWCAQIEALVLLLVVSRYENLWFMSSTLYSCIALSAFYKPPSNSAVLYPHITKLTPPPPHPPSSWIRDTGRAESEIVPRVTVLRPR